MVKLFGSSHEYGTISVAHWPGEIKCERRERHCMMGLSATQEVMSLPFIKLNVCLDIQSASLR